LLVISARTGHYALMSEEQETVPVGWHWGSRAYKNHGGDAEWLLREAQRRAVQIRDLGVAPGAVMLCDVLNSLQSALGYESVDVITFWSEFE
jgi:hypothetical protein